MQTFPPAQAEVQFKDLSIGAYFVPLHPQFKEKPLFQKTTNYHATEFSYDNLYNLVSTEVPFFTDELIFDASDPLDRRHIILQKGDRVVFPVYNGIGTGIVEDILPATKAALQHGFRRFRDIWNNKHIPDKRQYLWGWYGGNKFRQRVKVVQDGTSKGRCVKAAIMYRARLDLY